jgi:hypothetical protein
MISLEPHDRISIEHALKHSWIKGLPLDNPEEAEQLIKRTRRHKREASRSLFSRFEDKPKNKGLWHKYFGDKKNEDGI